VTIESALKHAKITMEILQELTKVNKDINVYEAFLAARNVVNRLEFMKGNRRE